MRWIEGLAFVCAALFFGIGSPASVLPAVSSQNLGSIAVNSSTTLSFQISGLSSTPSFGLQYGTEFSLTQSSCTTGSSITCTLGVNFQPKYAGLRQDAIQVFGNNGTLLAINLLHGIGLAPMATLRPGTITAFAGTGVLGNSGDNGLAINAELSNPQGLAIDTAGNLYIADSLSQVVRKVDITGKITTIAGNPSVTSPVDGGLATSTGLNVPLGLAMDGAGNLYIADSQNNRVRRVDALTNIITTVAGNGTVSANLGDGNLATAASLNNPTDVAVDAAGNLYIADQYNNRIRRVDAGTGIITTVAGGGTAAGVDGLGDGSPAVNASLSYPAGVAFDASGNLYIADLGNNLIREVSNGMISVFAGTALQNLLNEPSGVRIDAAGNVYIADMNNSLLWQVNGAGTASTLAGQAGQFGFNSNGIPADEAVLNSPAAIAIDPSGNIYIAEQGNRMVRKIVPGPASLIFTATSIGAISPPQAVSIDNIGNQALAFSAFGLTGNFVQQSTDFTDCSLGITVPAASSCSVAVAFAPQATGALSGLLSWQTNAQTAAVTLPLSGAGTGTANSDPAVNATTLSFTTQATGTASAAQVVTLTNSSTGTLSQPGISLSGSNAGDFSITTTCQSALAPNASCTVSVTFTPGAAGARSATLSLTETNTSTNVQLNQSVFLMGLGVIPPPVVSPAVMSFNTAGAASLPMTQTATLTNPSSLSLGIFSISTSRPDLFSINSNCPISLAPLSSCGVSVTFTPTASTVSPAVLTFTFSSGSSQTVSLTTGNPVIAITGATSSLGPQTRNLRSLPVPYGLQNLSTSPLAIQAISIGGTNANDFQQVNNCGTSIPAGQGCMIWLTYLPTGTSPALSNATIVVTDSAAGSPQSVGVTGAATGLSQARISIDNPVYGAVLSGTIPLSGWALSDNAAIAAVTLAVDGMSLGPATYGTNRPDVCIVFPLRAGCPNVGWMSSLDTTRISDGAHTLTVSASSSFGNTTVANPFTVANWASGLIKTTRVDIDYPSAAAVLTGTAVFAGWALDDSAAIASVSLTMDGVPLVAANYGITRSDVCKVFPGRSGCPNVGWNASVDTRRFSNGQHTLAVTAQTVNGTSATVTTSFQIGNVAPPGLTTCIDWPGSTPVSGTLSAAGWAIDKTTAIASVTLSVDGVPQGTASTVVRPDVCAVFGNQPGCPNVGWAGKIDTTVFADGVHLLGLLISTADAHEVAISKPFTVSNVKNTTTKTTLVDIDLPNPNSGLLSGVVQFTGWAIDQATPIASVEIAIDGIPASSIQPSVSRPDVCAAFPSTTGCPRVGWVTTVDTSSLSDGLHLLQVTATSQQGMRATNTATFVTSNATRDASQGQFVDMDYPLAGATVSGSAMLSGWAVNKIDNVQQVVITVDGVPAGTAVYGTSRADVCRVMQSTGCPNVGWSYVLDTTWLSNGVHTLRATEYGANGSATISRSIVVKNAPSSLTIDIDTPVINRTYSGVVTLGGWVIDNQSSVSAVTVAVDGLPIAPATYGISRPDVCTVFPGRPGCPDVGWSLSLDTSIFANGVHTLQLSAISSDNVRSTTALSLVVAN